MAHTHNESWLLKSCVFQNTQHTLYNAHASAIVVLCMCKRYAQTSIGYKKQLKLYKTLEVYCFQIIHLSMMILIYPNKWTLFNWLNCWKTCRSWIKHQKIEYWWSVNENMLKQSAFFHPRSSSYNWHSWSTQGVGQSNRAWVPNLFETMSRCPFDDSETSKCAIAHRKK